MGLVDKIKNFFYDEEEIEVKKPTVKEEPKKVAVAEEPKPKVEDEPKKNQPVKGNVEDAVSERELFRSEPTFKFPVIFEEDDFVEEKKKNNRINVLDYENNKAREVKSVQPESKKNFAPSPIISPVYGVLDKDYKKEDVTVKEDKFINLYDSTKKIDIDTVIQKAYGRHQEEPKKEEETNILLNIKQEESPIDLFKDIKEGETRIERREKKKITEIETEVETAADEDKTPSNEERLKSIDELLESTNERDFYTLVDSMYKSVEEGENEQ